MSAIAQAWVATLRVGNQTAKQLLQFYAAHNFSKPGFEFKNETLADQLETSESSIQRAHKLLLEKNLIIKEARYDKAGRQLSNIIYLNIPQGFVDNFFNRGGEGVSVGGGGCQPATPRGVTVTPLNNNINNNINNNAHCAPKPVDKKESQKEKGVPFSHFWEMYPNKKDKARAQKAWDKLTAEEKSAVMEKLPQQSKEDTQWQSKQYVPMASTYLNNKRWEDEIIRVTDLQYQKAIKREPETTKSTVKWFNNNH